MNLNASLWSSLPEWDQCGDEQQSHAGDRRRGRV